MFPCPLDFHSLFSFLLLFFLGKKLCVSGKAPSQVLGRQTCWKWVKDAHARTHTYTRVHAPHTLGGDYVLPSARLEHSVVWLIRPGTLMDEHIQPANKFTQLQFGTPLMRSYVHSAGWRANVCPLNLSPSFPLSLQTASS